ncbi:M17 family metallopeptidase [Nonomuraea sp. WAC 01424]|uniref:leucyl aminopeptidase family protein n=1 Tax=Nonomuraea sp. WAC 01424 TaxID=2203200 RepID=UPI000F76A40C|nr:leucyl aminopeptidase family protein [Nonomuraea sp. WAC 01424]
MTERVADVVVVPVGTDGAVPAPVAGFLAEAGVDVDVHAIGARLGPAEPGDVARVPILDGPDLVYVTVGDPRPGLAFDHVRAAAMAAARHCGSAPAVLDAIGCWEADPDCAVAAAEGWTLGTYRYRPDWTVTGLLARLDPGPRRHGGPEHAVREGVALGAAANLARDLINTPPGQLVPARLATVCQELGEALGFEVRVHDAATLEREQFGGIAGVGRGSVHPPCLIELRRGGDGPHTALVGKGITFDAGGLSLKPTRGMLTMKADMAGAAAVLGALVALARLGSDAPVRAYLPCAENMPGPYTVRIGDVLRHRGGRTVEVTNADCEGRLVVADAMAYAVEAGPAAIVDLATLTSVTGLGPDMWAGFGTDDALLARVLAAGGAAGEPGWAMPMWEPYRATLASDVADTRNFDPDAPQPYGAITAALYLEPFASGVPWAHLDLGLTVMRPAADARWAAGANGRGVRLLTRYLTAGAPALEEDA